MLAACTGQPKDFMTGAGPDIYPDYTDITVPVNIAPANFMIKDKASKYFTLFEAGNIKIKVTGKKVCIPLHKWKKLTAQGNITVTVFENNTNGWVKMNPFNINVADEIDSYLSYRVIPPLY